MHIFTCLCLSLIHGIWAIRIDGKDFKIMKGNKALLNITKTIGARSAIECATKCGSSNACTHANFRNSKCEFLNFTSAELEINLTDEGGSKYICKYEFILYIPLTNGCPIISQNECIYPSLTLCQPSLNSSGYIWLPQCLFIFNI